uniref:Uncharacterized protein n=1 Tax=Chaetoceros debilis TaxID=122233 RepID=A0A7S3V612_9STRA
MQCLVIVREKQIICYNNSDYFGKAKDTFLPAILADVKKAPVPLVSSAILSMHVIELSSSRWLPLAHPIGFGHQALFTTGCVLRMYPMIGSPVTHEQPRKS